MKMYKTVAKIDEKLKEQNSFRIRLRFEFDFYFCIVMEEISGKIFNLHAINVLTN